MAAILKWFLALFYWFTAMNAIENRCRYENVLYHREQQAINIGKPASGKGAIVILGQQRVHTMYGRNSLTGLNKTLHSLYAAYNERQKDDVIIFHDGDMDANTYPYVW